MFFLSNKVRDGKLGRGRGRGGGGKGGGEGRGGEGRGAGRGQETGPYLRGRGA